MAPASDVIMLLWLPWNPIKQHVVLINWKYKECSLYRIFLCISRFVYKSTPVFQAKNNNIFETLCISRPPWLMIQNQNKIEGTKDKKQ